ncbi:MAG TPA: class I SAM-dependent methyltransferase [Mycobacteriales bacterium]|nr:class I SAM-dependent methyltransferase [Mycobacteriales bacterium]
MLATRGFPGRDKAFVRYAVLGQHTVQGWLDPLGLQLIEALEQAQRDGEITGNVAEIGIHHGKLFLLLALLRRPGETALAVDLFEAQHLNVDSSGRADRAVFEANLRRWHRGSDGVVVHQADSSTMGGADLAALARGRCRLVSVDGGHTADLTEHDLETAADALSDGGVIILDDCFNELFPGVSEGAQRFLHRRSDVVAVGAAGNKTFLTQRAHAARYRIAMARRADELGLYHQEHESFVGQPFHSVFPPDPQRIAHWSGRALRWWSLGRQIANRRRSRS